MQEIFERPSTKVLIAEICEMYNRHSSHSAYRLRNTAASYIGSLKTFSTGFSVLHNHAMG